MAVIANASKTDASAPGATDGVIVVNHVSHSPSYPGDAIFYSIDYGDTYVSGGNSKVFTGLGAGIYYAVVRVNNEFSNPIELVISDGSIGPGPDPDPEDSLVYRKRFHGEVCDKAGVTTNVDFYQRKLITDDLPPIDSVIFAGYDSEPLIINYPDVGERKLNYINGSEVTVNLKAIDDFELSSLYTTDEREWQLILTGGVEWRGWVIPDSCSEPFRAKPYDVSIKATDALGTLKELPFQNNDDTRIKGWYCDRELLRLALRKTLLQMEMVIAVNTFEDGMTSASGKDPLSQSYINAETFLSDNGTPYSCYEVIRSILARYSSKLHQFNGKWQIVNMEEKSAGDVVGRRFRNDGFYLGLETIGNSVTAGGQDRPLHPTDGVSSIEKAQKASTAYYQYGYIANTLFNGSFDTWTSKPTGLPDGWSTFGGATASTGIRQKDGVDTTDYYLILDPHPSGGVIADNEVQVRANDVAKITFDMKATAANIGIPVFMYFSVLIESDNGEWFTENGWQSTAAYYVQKYFAFNLKNDQQVSIDIPSRPADYQLKFGVLSIGRVGGPQYETWINNVSISSSTETIQKPSIGEYVTITQLARQTFRPDPILILNSDDLSDQRLSPIYIYQSPTVRFDDAPGDPSVKWSRAGTTEELPILQIVADTELKAHARPYLIFEANFKGYGDIDINTLLSIDLIPSTFIFLSGSFNVKTGHRKLKFAEVLLDEPDSDIVFKEDYGVKDAVKGVASPPAIGV